MTDQATDVDQLAAQLVGAKEQMEAAKSALDDAKRAYENIEGQLAEAMTAAGNDLVKSGERYVSIRTTDRWSVPKENKDTLVERIKAHRPDLVKESVHSATLNKVASQMQTAPEPWWGEVEELLSKTSSTAVKVTKSKPRTKG